MKRVLLTLTAFALLAGPSMAKQLTAKEIEAELIGKTLCAKKQAGGTICVKHNAEGKSQIMSGGDKQTGVWRFKDNQHCTKWQKIRDGKEFCSTFDKANGKYSNSGTGQITVK